MFAEDGSPVAGTQGIWIFKLRIPLVTTTGKFRVKNIIIREKKPRDKRGVIGIIEFSLKAVVYPCLDGVVVIEDIETIGVLVIVHSVGGASA